MNNQFTLRHRIPRITMFALFVATGIPTFASAAESNTALASALKTIRGNDIQKHVNFLASDALEGREAGSNGSQAAGAYLLEKYEELGLAPAGDEGRYVQYFQNGYRNLLGLIPGEDERLSNEVIVVGAHYDHVGYGYSGNSRGPSGQIHNGADDNASGVSAVLEIAQAFHQSKLKPRRTILFALWDGEELGLLGSRHWTHYPTIDLKRVGFYINLDMVGRLSKNRLTVYGVRSGDGLRQLYSRNNHDRIQTAFDWSLVADSDHYPFLRNRIPFLMPFTGKHPDYHRPSDDANLLNYPGTEKIAQHWFRILHELTEISRLPQFRETSFQENQRVKRDRESQRGRATPRLGIAWNSDESDAEGKLIVRQVRPNSAAWSAGIRSGDVLTELNGIPYQNAESFRQIVSQASTQSVLAREVNSEDGDEPQTEQVPITLDGHPVSVGFSWRVDESDPTGLVINFFATGSPAVDAGLSYNDRIIAIDGQRVKSSQDARDMLEGVSGEFELSYERDGIIHQVRIAASPVVKPAQQPSRDSKVETPQDSAESD